MTLLREALTTDLAAMMAIETDVFGVDAWSAEQMAGELDRMTIDRWYGLVVVGPQEAGDVGGYVGLYLAPPDADVQTIAVARAAQGGGLASQLLSFAIDSAWARGCTRIFLEVRADNAAALALYRSAGFQRMGLRRRYYADGTDAVTMRLRRTQVDLLAGVHG